MEQAGPLPAAPWFSCLRIGAPAPFPFLDTECCSCHAAVDFYKRAMEEEHLDLTDKITNLLEDGDQGLRRLLDRGVNPNSKMDSHALLFWMATFHTAKCFKTLLARGRDFRCQVTVISSAGTYMETLLHTVCTTYCTVALFFLFSCFFFLLFFFSPVFLFSCFFFLLFFFSLVFLFSCFSFPAFSSSLVFFSA